jgi:hypothetical protein
MVAAAPHKSQIADEELTADRISKIEPKKIRNISNDQLQQISTEAIKNLTKPQISQLTTDQIVALIGDQIAAFTTKQISSFSSRQIKSIETSDIQQLTANQLSSLTKEEIMALTEDQMSALDIDQLNAFTDTNIKYLSSKQINSIQEESFIKLNNLWFQELTKTQMAGLEVNKINQLDLERINSIGFNELAFYIEKNAKKISAEFISKMEANNGSAIVFNGNTINKMEAAAIGSINPDVIARILPSAFAESQNFLDSLNQEQVSKITKLQVSAINSKLISSLSGNFLNSLNKNSFEALSVTQLGFLSVDQLINLNSDQLSTLHGTKLRSIDAKSLTVDQLASLSTDQIAELSAVQISALTTDQIKGMSVEQVQSIEVKDFSVLKSEQLNSMTLGQMNALDSRKIQEIASSKINSISTDIFSQLDFEVIKNFSKGQISKIDQSHLMAMSVDQLNTLSASQISAFNQKQIKNFTTSQLSQASSSLIGGLSIAQLRALSQSQINSLGPDQVSGIDATKLAKMKDEQLSSFSNEAKNKLDEIGATSKLSKDQKSFTKINTDIVQVNSKPLGVIKITGQFEVGGKLTAVNDITDADGISSSDVQYHWYFNNIEIVGANDSELTVSDSFLNKNISVTINYKDLKGSSESKSSGAYKIGNLEASTQVIDPNYLFINGSPGVDNFFGSEKNEIFNASSGGDYVDGGGGLDTVIVPGKFSDYKFEWGNNSLGAAGGGNGGGCWLFLTDAGVRVSVKVSDYSYNFGDQIDLNHLKTEFITFKDSPGVIVSVADTWKSFGNGVGDFKLIKAANFPDVITRITDSLTSSYDSGAIFQLGISGVFPNATQILSSDCKSVFAKINDGVGPAKIVKYLVDGKIDQSWGNNGELLVPFNQIYDINEQKDGSLIVGLSQHQSGNFDNAIGKINSNGEWDFNFAASGICAFPSFNPTFNLTGSFVSNLGDTFAYGTNNNGSELVVYKIDKTGALDSKFGNGGVYRSSVPNPSHIIDFSISSDGKLIILNSNANADYSVIYLNSNGVNDSNFGVSGSTTIADSLYTTSSTNVFNPTAIQEDSLGRILIVGSSYDKSLQWPASTSRGAFRVISKSGVSDAGFGENGTVYSSYLTYSMYRDFKVQSLKDGKFLTAAFNSGSVELEMFNPDGSPDKVFGVHGKLFLSNSDAYFSGIDNLSISNDGSLFVTGHLIDGSKSVVLNVNYLLKDYI